VDDFIASESLNSVDCSGGAEQFKCSDLGQFIATPNVARFPHQLENGGDEFTGTRLLKLLREAEKSCLTRQQLDRMDCHMAELRRLAYRQVELVETGQLQGHGVARALKLLAMSNDLMATYQTLRRRITQLAE
jgi:hypothetical protein